MHAQQLTYFARVEDTSRIPREWVEASDWFVIFTLGTLFFLLGAFAMWAWLIWRRTTRPQPHVKLLMELEDEAARESRPQQTTAQDDDSPRHPWEKSADWWKKTDS